MLQNNYSTDIGAPPGSALPESEKSQDKIILDPAGYYAGEFSGLNTFGTNVMVKCVFHDDQKPSLSLNLKTGAFNCFGCSAKGTDIFYFHMKKHRVSRNEAIAQLSDQGFDASSAPARSSDRSGSEWENRLYLIRLAREASRSEVGDLLHQYIVQTRRIPLAEIPPTLGLHPGLPYRDEEGKHIGSFPAMIAAVLDSSDRLVAIHRTFLSHDGKKAPVPSPKKLTKAVFPGATKGAAIQLFDAGAVLAVAEGIETALAVHAATNLPVWATVSAAGMESIVLPEIAREIIICVDKDRSGRGEKAARVLAGRAMREGRSVKLAIPNGNKVDWADVLRGSNNG